MGKKGTPHRKWSKEEKLRFIRLHLDEHISIKEIERKYGVGHSLVSAWVKRYLEDGEEAPGAKERKPVMPRCIPVSRSAKWIGCGSSLPSRKWRSPG